MATLARKITVAEALKEWIASKKVVAVSTADLHAIFFRKFQSWATENLIEYPPMDAVKTGTVKTCWISK